MDAGSLIGFIGDIHGDLEALEWALEALQDADRIISLGDVVDGRHDLECIQLLQERKITVVQGNHDAWAALEERHFEAPIREWLGRLPRCLAEEQWMAWHSYHVQVPQLQWPNWLYLLDDRTIREALASRSEQVLFSGHTHIAGVNVLEGSELRYIGGEALRTSPRIKVEPARRYTVCAGRPTECVVVYDTRAQELEYRFRRTPALPRQSRLKGYVTAAWRWLRSSSRS